MIKFPRACLAAAMFTLTAPAFAIVPQQGMWSIGSEVNGKPGRGIQLDRQGGDYLILTYIGYRPDGSSMFLQASGKLKDGMFFSGDLTEYKNGRALGGGARDGELAQVVGPIAIKFDSTTSGTVTLPGEEPKRFSRYQYEDHLARLDSAFEYRSYNSSNSARYANATAVIRSQPGQFSMTEVMPASMGNSECKYSGDLRPTGETFSSSGTRSCLYPNSTVPSTLQYQLVDINVDEHGMFSARLFLANPGTEALQAPIEIRHFQGACLTGGPEFADGSRSRCRPSELGIGGFTPSDWISPSWIPAR